ncbi:hypothetical protein DERP_002438, partial [Dermatophagoides pteronyssinus]
KSSCSALKTGFVPGTTLRLKLDIGYSGLIASSVPLTLFLKISIKFVKVSRSLSLRSIVCCELILVQYDILMVLNLHHFRFQT